MLGLFGVEAFFLGGISCGWPDVLVVHKVAILLTLHPTSCDLLLQRCQLLELVLVRARLLFKQLDFPCELHIVDPLIIDAEM